MIESGLTTEEIMRSFENDAEVKEEEVEEEEEVTSRNRPLWDQDEDSDMDEWIGIVGGWIKSGEPKRKEESESSRKPKTESPKTDDAQMNGWLDAPEREMEEEEGPETESGWIAAINVWDSSDEEDGGADIWDEEIQSESDEEVAKKSKTESARTNPEWSSLPGERERGGEREGKGTDSVTPLKKKNSL